MGGLPWALQFGEHRCTLTAMDSRRRLSAAALSYRGTGPGNRAKQ